MAVKFSKNGKPVGRNKAIGKNKSSRWTPAEDNYLRIALQEGISTEAVSARLGRTISSVWTRKHNLGLEGRFSSSRGTKFNPQVVRVINAPTPETSFGPGIMELETGVPLPSRTGRNDEMRAKLRSLFEKMSPGQSFVIPRNLAHVATYLANKEFGSYKIRTKATSPDKKFYRVFRIL